MAQFAATSARGTANSATATGSDTDSHAADSNPKKIDLGIGVYKDEAGNTPILECVRRAEQILDSTQTSKSYLGPPGVAGFNSAMTALIFGA